MSPGQCCHMGGKAAPGHGTDAEYLRRSLSQPQEFSVLYTRHSVAVFRFLARQTDRHAAEDLLTEVFLTAFRIRGRYDTSAPDALPWLLGIAANTARHHHRSRARFMALKRRIARRNEMTRSEDFRLEQRLDAEATRPQVATALIELTSSHREVLLLSSFDLNYEEMAKALNVPVGTIRSRLSRARTQMRELLGPGGKYSLDTEQSPWQATRQAGEVDG
jgi:RNA polymerase sigma factor (sigma-70 family)